MAQATMAREPSMDEILASIRKIIESNETVHGDAFPRDVPGSDGYDSDEDIELTIDQPRSDRGEAEGSDPFQRQEESRQPAETALEPVAAMPPPMSLADVAARVRAASERHGHPAVQPVRETEAAPRAQTQAAVADSPVTTARMATASAPRALAPSLAEAAANRPLSSTERALAAAVQLAADLERVDRQSQEARITGTRFAEAQPPFAEVEAVEAAVPVADTDIPLVEPDVEAQSVFERTVSAIVSPAVGQQVARSFETLAVAVDMGAQRSFDEIAEDMMRPMLQEWLDDNLPTLVERLVREEIERVARGPRR